MKRNFRLALVTAAGIGMLSVPLWSVLADPGMDTPVKMSDQAADRPLRLPDGFAAKDLGDASGIKNGLVKLTERFVGKGDFNSLLAELATPDKEKARSFEGVNQKNLDGIIVAIQAKWKEKYGQEFDISDKNLIFDNTFAIATGEVSDQNAAVAHWPVKVLAGDDAAAGTGDSMLTKGTDVALIRFPKIGDMPELNISMVHETMFWRIDIAGARTGQQIYTDVTNRLNFIRDHSDKWPANVADAYRVIAFNAVASVYGVPLPAMK